MQFSEKPFEDDKMNKLPSSALPHVFVPIDEVPDDRPDPSEALMLKEEGDEEKEEKPKKGERVDTNDLSRVPSYLGKEFKETTPVSSNGRPTISTESEKIVNALEEVEARTKVPMDWGKDSIESHGKHGRKPLYKDRRKTPLA